MSLQTTAENTTPQKENRKTEGHARRLQNPCKLKKLT